jgi:phage-related tail fiber protein
MALPIGNGLNLLLQRIVNLGDPQAPTDAATKQYVDNLIRGLDWKPSVKVATTANLAALSGLLTIDGVTLAAGDRVLVKDQTDGTQNGIYVVATGAWSRATDFNDGLSITSAAATSVELGSTNADSVWILTTDGTVTVGTTTMAFSKLGGGITYVQGNGILIVGSTVSAKATTSGGLIVDASGIRVDRSVTPQKYAANVPAGSTGAVSHSLNTTDLTGIMLYDISGAKPVLVLTDATITDANTVTFSFGTAATSGQYRAVISG